MPESLIIMLAIIGALIFVTFAAAMTRYKTCPSNKLLVVYGKVGGGESARTRHGGAAFVWPLIQQFEYLDLTHDDRHSTARRAVETKHSG